MTAHMVPHKRGPCDTNGHHQHRFPTVSLVSFCMSHPLTVNGSNGTPGIAGPALFDTFTQRG
eukprot:scaffold55188_cov70-Attheya_sp.AAC.2